MNFRTSNFRNQYLELLELHKFRYHVGNGLANQLKKQTIKIRKNLKIMRDRIAVSLGASLHLGRFALSFGKLMSLMHSF